MHGVFFLHAIHESFYAINLLYGETFAFYVTPDDEEQERSKWEKIYEKIWTLCKYFPHLEP